MMKLPVLSVVLLMLSAATGLVAAEDLRGDVAWKPAPSAAPAGAVTPLPALEDIAAALRQPAAPTPPKAPPTVVEGELFPMAYRNLLRRYFDLLHTAGAAPAASAHSTATMAWRNSIASEPLLRHPR